LRAQLRTAGFDALADRFDALLLVLRRDGCGCIG
jgi:hypothetical protein